MARRSGAHVSYLTSAFSNDPQRFSRRRRLLLGEVDAMLAALRCNLADLVYELDLYPTFGSWPICQELEHSLGQSFGPRNQEFLDLSKNLEQDLLEKPKAVIERIYSFLPEISGKVVLEAALILGPALRTDRQASMAAAVLRWVVESESASRMVRGLALQKLAYAQGSVGRMTDALHSALEAQDLFRLEGDLRRVAQGEIDKAIFRGHLEDYENSTFGFQSALKSENILSARSTAAAIHGLAVNAIRSKNIDQAHIAIRRIRKYEVKLPMIDVGKLRWAEARLHIILCDPDSSRLAFLESCRILRELRSEDAFVVFLDYLKSFHTVNHSKDDFVRLIYGNALTTIQSQYAEELAKAVIEGNLKRSRIHEIAIELGDQPKPKSSTNSHLENVVRKLLKQMARRFDVQVSYLTSAFSDDPQRFSRRRRLLLGEVDAMLATLKCNLADLVYELALYPTFGSWPICQTLERSLGQSLGPGNREFLNVSKALQQNLLAKPKDVIERIYRFLPEISGEIVLEAALILGPALRLNRQAPMAVAVLRWAAESKSASRMVRGLALQKLAYAQGSADHMTDALHSALEAQDLFRLEGDLHRVAQGEIDKAIFRGHLEDHENSTLGFQAALKSEDTLSTRSTAAAIHGLAVNAIRSKNVDQARVAIRRIRKYESRLPPIDIGKLRWAEARLSLVLKNQRRAQECFQESTQILAECGSEDSLRVFVEMLTLIDVAIDPQDFTLSVYQASQGKTKLADELAALRREENLTTRNLLSIRKRVGTPSFGHLLEMPGMG